MAPYSKMQRAHVAEKWEMGIRNSDIFGRKQSVRHMPWHNPFHTAYTSALPPIRAYQEVDSSSTTEEGQSFRMTCRSVRERSRGIKTLSSTLDRHSVRHYNGTQQNAWRNHSSPSNGMRVKLTPFTSLKGCCGSATEQFALLPVVANLQSTVYAV
ncbi:hypothetical protein H6P81_006091 [Aristolochia fimbriata]|uniref:Uncharacterized protein n=1 Tax=Aristolochia fimbriata TaxID=158543 RepID=A0AAV7EWH7_ARIFI|nr:hypothetical protein H6P81_006091 [Aristolochia fimbriata]